jgi:hypothetical protein
VDETVRGELTTVLELVSHETRARTLVELAVRQRESPHDEWLSFSELRRRVGHDDPGNFNYHLGRLRGSLIEQTDAGYRLSDVGHEFVAVLLSSRFDPDGDIAVPDGTVSCLLCSASAHPAAVDGRLLVECDAGHTFAATVGPDVLVDQPLADALNIALFHTLSDLRLALSGVCALCDGPVEQHESAAGGEVDTEIEGLRSLGCCTTTMSTYARASGRRSPTTLAPHDTSARSRLGSLSPSPWGTRGSPSSSTRRERSTESANHRSHPPNGSPPASSGGANSTPTTSNRAPPS